MPPARKKHSAVFSARGHLGSPAAVTSGFRPALWSCVAFATLAAVTAVGITAGRRRADAQTHTADVRQARTWAGTLATPRHNDQFGTQRKRHPKAGPPSISAEVYA